MKKLKLAVSAAAALILTAGSLFAQNIQTRTVNNPGPFDAVNISGTQTVHFEIGPSGDPITVIGHPEDLDNMEIKVVNGTLNIGYKKRYNSLNPKSTQVYVKNSTLAGGSVSGTGTLNISGNLDDSQNSFSVSGTGRVNVERIECRELTCSVSGTGRITCPTVIADAISTRVSGTGSIVLTEIEAVSVAARTSGTGKIEMSGTCHRASMSTSGTGSIHAGDLEAVDVEASSGGTGSVYCHATGKFEGKVSGTGRIYLGGNPESVKFSGKSGRLVQR
ncbi:MAG: DUF2807 domain-containing protein [Rikenellaceae bacterium]|nr:DUF2807 domain-containing protein [Rikenellaceae bacterium]